MNIQANKSLGNNSNEIIFENGTEVLVSFASPVAAYVRGEGFLITKRTCSKAESKQILDWIETHTRNRTVPQDVLDRLMETGEI